MWITISIVVFFTILIIASFYSTRIVNSTSRTSKWPPTINKCPDYWELSDTATQCFPKVRADGKFVNNPSSSTDSSSTGCSVMDPYLTIGGTPKQTLTDKAKTCGIAWDGINGVYTL